MDRNRLTRDALIAMGEDVTGFQCPRLKEHGIDASLLQKLWNLAAYYGRLDETEDGRLFPWSPLCVLVAFLDGQYSMVFDLQEGGAEDCWGGQTRNGVFIAWDPNIWPEVTKGWIERFDTEFAIPHGIKTEEGRIPIEHRKPSANVDIEYLIGGRLR